MEEPSVKIYKTRTYTKTDVYRESANAVLQAYFDHAWPLSVQKAFSFITYDSTHPNYDAQNSATWTADLYLGTLTLELEAVEDISDEEMDQIMQDFITKPEVARHIDPPLWAKFWDWLTKTKG